jgi:hypothetical protein
MVSVSSIVIAAIKAVISASRREIVVLAASSSIASLWTSEYEGEAGESVLLSHGG